MLKHSLMENNITREDLDALIQFLKRGDPILTQSSNVLTFEQEWSDWLGVEYSVFVNSGSSANLLTMTTIKQMLGVGEIIVPPLTWVSDIASVLQNGFKPVFVDINPRNLCIDEEELVVTKKKVIEVEVGMTDNTPVRHPKSSNGYYFVNGILLHD